MSYLVTFLTGCALLAGAEPDKPLRFRRDKGLMTNDTGLRI